MQQHEFFIRKCIDLARKGNGLVSPNPMVGSIIVHKGNIIGSGYHEKFGCNHAEVNAISSVKDKKLLKESTLYVNLEPCSHFGKTPPCSDLIIKSKNQEYSSFKYELYDLNSKLVSKGNSRINESISISHLINGIYILNILTNEKSEAHRIIKR